jgi:hypothetical protein
MKATWAHPLADWRGVNLFNSDPMPCEMLPLHLPAELFEHLLPHLAQCVLRLRVLSQDTLAIEDERDWLNSVPDEKGAGPRAGVAAVQLF